MSQRPTRGCPSWSVGGHTAAFPAPMAGLVDSSGKCPLPGVPSSVKASKPGSPVRSLGWSVMVHPVGSPIRLCPREVSGPPQSSSLPAKELPARSMFSRTTVPDPFVTPLAFPAMVLLRTVAVPLSTRDGTVHHHEEAAVQNAAPGVRGVVVQGASGEQERTAVLDRAALPLGRLIVGEGAAVDCHRALV